MARHNKSPTVEMCWIDGIDVPTNRARSHLSDETIAGIMKSIDSIGLQTPITVSLDDETGIGTLIAGAHRLEAAKRLGWEQIPALCVQNWSEEQARMWEISENLHRAELTVLERDEHIAEWIRLADLHSSQFATNESMRVDGRGHRKAGGVRAASRALGIDKDDAHRAVKVASLSPEAKEAAREAGLDNNRSALLQIAKAKKDIQAEVARRVAEVKRREAEQKRAKVEAKKELRARRESELAAKQVSLPDRKYGVIYADPEWRFETFSENGKDRAADNHYPTSDTGAIMERDVSSIAAPDSVLFLWATAPMIRDALSVMEAWGFQYKSQFVWVKDKAGTGYWNRNRHEILLVGTRGSIPAPAPGTQWPSAIEAPAGRHSEKPEVFRDLIETYFPSLPKIELNCRGAPRAGWAAWGDEAEETASTLLVSTMATAPDRSPSQIDFERLRAAWCGATPEERAQFLNKVSPHIDEDRLAIICARATL